MKPLFIILISTIIFYSCQNETKSSSSDTLILSKADSVMIKYDTVRGRVSLGHESSSFRACQDTAVYWVDDSTQNLEKKYSKVIGKSLKPYEEVYAELLVEKRPKPTEGYAADYSGVYVVKKILKVERLTDKSDCGVVDKRYLFGMGNEPGWAIDIRHTDTDTLSFSLIMNYGDEKTSGKLIQTKALDGKNIDIEEFTGRDIHKTDLVVIFKQEDCIDDAGKPHTGSLLLKWKGKTYRGCGDYQ